MPTARRACERALSTLAIAALLLTLSACQPGGTRPIIKVGLEAPFSGFDESIGYSVIGAVRLAVRERNLSGGVAGYSIELVALDDGNEPDTAAQRAREMIVDPAVMVVLGGFDGSATQAAATQYERAGMPFVTLAADEVESRLAFRLAGSASEAGRRAGDFAARILAARRIAIVSERISGQDVLSTTFAAAALAGEAAIIYSTPIERWQLDFSGVVGELSVVSPDLVFFVGRAAEAGELLKQMRAAGIKAAFLGGPGVDDPRLAQIAGSAAQGVTYVSLGFALPQVTDATTRDRLAEASLRPAGAYTVLAYDGTQLVLDALARAIKAQGKPTRAVVTAALRASRFQGISGEISFDEQGNRRVSPVGVFKLADTYPGSIVP